MRALCRAARPGLAAETVAAPEPSEETLRYYHSGNIPWPINVAPGFLIPLALLFTGLSAKIRDLAASLARRSGTLSWFLTILFYFVIYTLVIFIIDLPPGYYQGFLRGHDYGLSNQSFKKCLEDFLIAQAVGLAIGGAILRVPYLLLRRAPSTRRIRSGLAAIPFMKFMIYS